MNVSDIAADWLGHVDEADRKAVADLIAGPASDLADAFWRDLAFGTGGMRAVLGMGTNRLNSYTVARASQGVASYLASREGGPQVAIAYDTRRMSRELAERAACVFAGNGVQTYLFSQVAPTPLLSFAVRDLGCDAGIVITASHNPAEYNGFKVYGSDGCQITTEAARAIQREINAVEIFRDVLSAAFERAVDGGFIRYVPHELVERYYAATLSVSTGEPVHDVELVYSPLNGTGNVPVRTVLERLGVDRIEVVGAQELPDPFFTTCPKPNPENQAALELGFQLCRESGISLLVATDPDADRVGVGVLHEGAEVRLSGNEIGLLLLDWLASRLSDADCAQKVAMTTIVSAPMADDIARHYGFELRRTLTGFKFIGEQIGLLEQEGRVDNFLFAFEESLGYLKGTDVRDKDGVQAVILICELVAHYRAQGMDLVDARDDLYRRFGSWSGTQMSVDFPGEQGARDMDAALARLRSTPPSNLAGIGIDQRFDYRDGAPMPAVNGTGAAQMLPPANVLEYRLQDGSRILIRPSGTEPKLKVYVFARGASMVAASSLCTALEEELKRLLLSV